MSKKIILFLSGLRENAAEAAYLCPDGRTVTGRQTNEAPVKYLLQAYPDIREILCIVTEQARKSAWAWFLQMVHGEAPDVSLTEIPFADGERFGQEMLAAVIRGVRPDDEILLETTGGFRNAIMYLLLLSRTLSYAGMRTVGAVYSNFEKKQIEDITPLIELFDLVGGMQELTSFGNARTLQEHYARQQKQGQEMDAPVRALLSAMQALYNDISLCRTGRLERRMADFNAAMEAAEQAPDPMLQALLPVFQEKFGRQLTVPGLIRWCTQNGMIQQALTIYRERIPTYILRDREDLLRIKPAAGEVTVKNYETEEAARFSQLFGISLRKPNLDSRYYDTAVRSMENLEQLLPKSYFTALCPVEQLRRIMMDYEYIWLLRNMVSHANDTGADGQQELIDYLNMMDPLYKRPESASLEEIRRVIERALENLKPAGRKNKSKALYQ